MTKFEDLKQRIANTIESFEELSHEVLNIKAPFAQMRNYGRLQHIEIAMYRAKADLLDAYLSDRHIAKMIAIAEVQSELREMGLTDTDTNFIQRQYVDSEKLSQPRIKVCFFNNAAYAFTTYSHTFDFKYSLEKWQQDLLNKVKELING